MYPLLINKVYTQKGKYNNTKKVIPLDFKESIEKILTEDS